jgi:type I restriction enzyme, S subunit
MRVVPLAEIITSAPSKRAGAANYPVLSMTMHHGLVDQTMKFKKRVASEDISEYKVVNRGQLVVGFPIDEGVLDIQDRYDAGIVSPAYGVWDVRDARIIDQEYLKLFLRSPWAVAYYKAKLRGSTARRRSLPSDVFLALEVPLPPIDQQERIAAFLGKADALRIRCHEVLTRLDLLAQSTMAQFLEGANGQVRPLVELIDAGDRLNYGVVQPGGGEPGGVPLVRVSDLKNGLVDRTNLKTISPDIDRAYARSRLKGTEVLVVCVGGSIGKIALAGNDDIGSNVARAVARVPISDPALRKFVAAYLKTSEAQQFFMGELRTVAQPTLNIKQLSETRILVPEPTDLLRINTYIEKIDSQVRDARLRLAKYETLASALLYRAFSER